MEKKEWLTICSLAIFSIHMSKRLSCLILATALCVLDGAMELLSQGLCCNNHNCSQEEKGGPERATGGVVNNNHYLAPALFEVGLDSEGDDTRQLNNAEQTGADGHPLKVSTLIFASLFLKL